MKSINNTNTLVTEILDASQILSFNVFELVHLIVNFVGREAEAEICTDEILSKRLVQKIGSAPYSRSTPGTFTYRSCTSV